MEAVKEVGSESSCSFIRCRWVPAKCNILIWMSCLDRIPTRQALARRNFSIDSEDCVLCGEAIESWITFSRLVRSRISSGVGFVYGRKFLSFLFSDLMEVRNFDAVRKEAMEIIQGLIYVGCWCIWKARNNKLFSNGEGKSEDIFGEVRSLGFFWFKCRSKIGSVDW
ncbi:uncharacterized protein LOC110892729 [Helianthus annuus]|uniref:uncharacterized protein LOC110892729 n=1 Tax=Helianthus annuus TaxID=4232 RepID=UPI000B904884|nr:uncharacterized protein LOC110892729 [Helianthus annuus]